ncbi:MAG: ABC transporter substrate-binding protein [Spirochaetaceae bacterium]|jgi:NitT/TauT family transport system substrate-binding protein|nr:ABC transporter substrate-binding protein [Spirochaetaceae bacterium]
MKRVFGVLVVVTALLTVSAGGREKAANSEDDYVLKIAYGISTNLCSAPFFIAEEKGFYKAEGLKYEAVKIDTSQIPQLITAGTIDVALNLIASMIQPLANGLDVKIPLTVHTGCIKVLVDPNSDIRTPADLKGRRIGIGGMGSAPTIIVQRYLAELGIGTMAPNIEVEWVIFPSSELPLALERGQVDAIAVTDPAALVVENSGKGRVVINMTSDPQMKDEFCCVLVASSKAANAHPESLAKMARAIQKASRYVQENPEETARLMVEKKYLASGDPKVNAEALASYSWDASVSEAKASLSRNLNDFQKIGLIPANVDVNALLNSTFLALPGVPDRL